MELNLKDIANIDLIEQLTPSEILKQIGKENISPANPEGRIYHNWAMTESMRRSQENENAKQLLLATAKGDRLDYIGETYYRNSDGSKILRKPGEDDDSYRMALQESPEGLTSAGTLASYNFHCKRSHELLNKNNVSCYSPEPMVMNAYFFVTENIDEVKSAIEQYVSRFVPSGDLFSAVLATELSGSIDASIRLSDSVAADLVKAEGVKRLTSYIESQTKIKGVISDSGVKAALTLEGVDKVTLNNWSDLDCNYSQIPKVTGVSVVYE